MSVPAGVATGLFGEGAETELHCGGLAGVFGTVAGFVASARAPPPTIAGKLDLLSLTTNWGLVTLAFAFVAEGYLSRYVATLCWKDTTDHDSE